MTQRPQHLLARAPELGLNVLVVGSALAIGAVHPLSGLVVAALAALFAMPALAEAARARRSLRLPLLVFAAAFAGLWCLFQTLPVGGLAEGTSPAVAGLWSLADAGPAHLSGNLAATRSAGFRYLLAALLLAGAAVWYRRADRVHALADLVIVSASIVAVTGLVQAWLKADTILFLYEPRMGPVRVGAHGPFVNPDHFGAYTAVGALLALSRGALMQVQRRRFLDYALGTLLVAACFLSLSFSAVLGLLVGLGWLVIVWWRRDRKLGDVLGVVIGIGVAAAFLTLLAVSLNVVQSPEDGVRAQLEALPGQATIWGETWRLALGAPLVGVGSGTLPDLLGARLDVPALSVWYARDQPLQGVVDLGFPLGLLLLLAAGLLLRRLFTRWPMDHLPNVLPIVVALVGLVTISLVDFALEIPALGIVGSLLAGAVWAQARRFGTPPGRAAPRLARRVALGLAGLLAAGTLGASAWAFATERRAEDALETIEDVAAGRVDEDAAPLELLHGAARARLAVRPGQARLYATVGHALLRYGEAEQAREWLRTAVQLRPKDATAQQLLALGELRSGAPQAAVERLETAMAANPAATREIVALIIEETDDKALWIGLTPDAARQRLLVTELLTRGRAVDALRYAGAILEEDPDSPAGFEAGARAAFELGLDDLAEYYADNLARVEPDSAGAAVVQARVRLRRGDVEGARELVEGVLAEHPDDYGAWYALGEILLRRVEADPDSDEALEQMREVRDHLRPIALADPDLRIEFYRLSARFYLAAHQWRAAASAAQHGIEAGATYADLYDVRGLALFELRDYARAAEALRRAIELGSTDPDTLDAWTRIATTSAPTDWGAP